MGMDTYAVGFRPADDKWEKMKKIYETCDDAGVDVPEEVEEFFNYEPPDDKPGMEVDLGGACKEWGNDWASGYEIDVSKLPKDVKIIRVYNSW